MAIEFRNELSGDVLRKFQEYPNVFFQLGVYAFSNEEDFFDKYVIFLDENIANDKAKAAIIGGGDPAHFMMGMMEKHSNGDDLYLVDLNPDQITVELAKLNFIQSHDYQEVEDFFKGGLNESEYQSHFDNIRRTYAIPSLKTNLGDLFKRKAQRDKSVWNSAGYSRFFSYLKSFVGDAYSGKRNLIFVLSPIRDFLENYHDKLGLVYLSNVHEWASLDKYPEKLSEIPPRALSPGDFSKLKNIIYFGNSQKNADMGYFDYGFYCKT